MTITSIRRGLFAVLLLAASAAAQAVQVERVQKDFNVLFAGGEYMDVYALGSLDHKSQDQVNSNSEATVSKFDLKAPGRARNEYTRGLRYLAKDDLKSAIASLQKAISIYPRYVAAHSALGSAYYQLKKYEMARQEFSQAIALDDHLSSAYLNLGRAQLALGELPAAQASMEKASTIAPLDHQLLLALTYTYYAGHNYQDAIKTAQRAHSQSHPDTAIVHYFAAASWQALNNLPEARTELQTFLTEAPNSAFAEAAQRVAEQIRVAEEQPKAAVESSAPVLEPLSKEPVAAEQEASQDLKEQQQIAEADAEGSACSSCVSNAPGPSGTGISEISSPGARNPKSRPWALRSTVNEVAVFFSATDSGKSVSDLRANEVTILDDNKPPAAVLSFHSESDLPLRLGLLIDTSASITGRFAFEQRVAADFLKQVMNGKDDVAFVAGFSNSVVLTQDFTPELERLAHGINQLVPVGGTAIWDAVAFAADKLAEKQDERPVARILVVISDGEENSSSATLKQAIERAERDEVIVYTVSTRYSNAAGQQSDLTGNRALKTLTTLTGGVAFFPGSADHLNRSFAELQQVIRSRYLISYRPAAFSPDGHYRPIAIVAERSGRKLRVNARKGYYSNLRSMDGKNSR